MSVFSKIDMFSPHAVDTVARSKLQASYGDHSHTKLALLVTKITYIKNGPSQPHTTRIREWDDNGVPIVISMPHEALGMSLAWRRRREMRPLKQTSEAAGNAPRLLFRQPHV